MKSDTPETVLFCFFAGSQEIGNDLSVIRKSLIVMLFITLDFKKL